MSVYKPKQPAANDSGLPAALSDAIASAEQLLRARDGVYQILATSHTAIPELLRERQSLLAELSRAEVTDGDVGKLQARLGDIDLRLDESRRKRRGAVGVLLNDQKVGTAELLKAKDAIGEARREYASTTVAEFERLLEEENSRLQALWRYGESLGAALGVSIPMPIPARLATSAVRPAEIERVDGPEAAVSLPAPIERLREITARLDQALSLCQSITRSKGFDMRRDKLQSIGSASAMQNIDGVFQVVAHEGIVCGLDLLRFEHGKLIDADLIGGGPLQRLLVARAVRRVDSLAMVTSPSAA